MRWKDGKKKKKINFFLDFCRFYPFDYLLLFLSFFKILWFVIKEAQSVIGNYKFDFVRMWIMVFLICLDVFMKHWKYLCDSRFQRSHVEVKLAQKHTFLRCPNENIGVLFLSFKWAYNFRSLCVACSNKKVMMIIAICSYIIDRKIFLGLYEFCDAKWYRLNWILQF